MQAPSTLSLGSTTDIHVIRRDGSTTPLEINKIRTVVNWACCGLSTNSIALEAHLTTRLRPGITTREIQDNLIRCALDLCSPEEPDWRYVAGRLHIWSLWKDTKVSRGYQYGYYARTVHFKVLEGQYDRRILTYSPEELEIANTWINPDWDADYDYAGSVLLTKRYLLANELPQEAFLTCALLIASVETPDKRLTWAKQFYEAIACRQISLATPILANLRIPNGSLASCFITAMDDNLESINSVTAPEIALCMAEQISQEAMHNQSYQYIIETVILSDRRTHVYDFWRSDRMSSSIEGWDDF